MNTSRLLCLAALVAALPFAAQAQHDPGPNTPPVVDLKPPPDSATPQAAGTPSPNDTPADQSMGSGPAGGGAAGGASAGMSMDANGDGLLSREEFLLHQEGVYERMPKTADGQVDLREAHSEGAGGR